jgi:hypothetical protein
MDEARLETTAPALTHPHWLPDRFRHASGGGRKSSRKAHQSHGRRSYHLANFR